MVELDRTFVYKNWDLGGLSCPPRHSEIGGNGGCVDLHRASLVERMRFRHNSQDDVEEAARRVRRVSTSMVWAKNKEFIGNSLYRRRISSFQSCAVVPGCAHVRALFCTLGVMRPVPRGKKE